MSIASRQPRPVSAGAASHPALVDHSGNLDRAAIRSDVRSRTRALPGPFRWTSAQALADTFQKVRLQRQWALKAAAENAALERDAAAAREAFEQQALATAEKHNFDVTALTFQVTRWSASLGARWDAKEMQRLHRRALEIACERFNAEQLIAAE